MLDDIKKTLCDTADEFYFADATPEELAAELEVRDYYKSTRAQERQRLLGAEGSR